MQNEQPQDDQSFDDAFQEFAKIADGETPVPEADPGDEQPEQQPAEAAPATGEPAAVDLWAGVAPELKQKYEEAEGERRRLIHQRASEQGRIQAAQRVLKLHEESLSREQAAPSARELASAAMSTPRMRALKQDYPEFAEAMTEVLTALSGHTDSAMKTLGDKITQTTQPLLQAQESSYSQQVDAAIEAAVPNWKQDLHSPHFTTWLEQQPGGIQALVLSEDVNDAIAMMRLFKQGTQPPAAAAAEAQDTPKNNPKLDRLARAADRPSGRQPTAALIPEDDFDGAFNHFAKRVDDRLAKQSQPRRF